MPSDIDTFLVRKYAAPGHMALQHMYHGETHCLHVATTSTSASCDELLTRTSLPIHSTCDVYGMGVCRKIYAKGPVNTRNTSPRWCGNSTSGENPLAITWRTCSSTELQCVFFSLYCFVVTIFVPSHTSSGQSGVPRPAVKLKSSEGHLGNPLRGVCVGNTGTSETHY